MTEGEKETAVGKPFEVVALVTTKLREYTESKELILPTNYSIENALKSAWLALQETVDKDRQPALKVCSQASIANALLNMAVQGLNPGKNQCYFIVYGTKLVCQRSYFGTMAVAHRVAGVSDIYAEVVYESDKFEYGISHNQKTVIEHTQKIGNIKPDAIVAAYCVLEFKGDKPAFTEIMTIEQIKKAWAKSKVDTGAPGSTHSQFPEEMAKRTVTNRACKALINSSSDDNLFLEHYNRSDEEQSAAELEAEIDEKADKEVLELDGKVITAKEVASEGFGIQEEGATETQDHIYLETSRDPETITTVTAMLKACFDDFGMEKARVLAELRVTTQAAIVESPADCYIRIAAVMAGPEKSEGKPTF